MKTTLYFQDAPRHVFAVKDGNPIDLAPVNERRLATFVFKIVGPLPEKFLETNLT